MRWLWLVAVLACGGCESKAEAQAPTPTPIALATDALPPRKKRPAPSATALKRSTASKPTKSQPSELELAKQAARKAVAEEDTARRALALQVAQDIADRRYSYDRKRLAALQARAGLKPDGLYGGASAGMLRHYVQPKLPPRPLFKPTTEKKYDPQ